ncbi:unnamed protein product [Rangifer tarandus platyrhynchus]|uniref:Uncharacterized protein n=2 Tax=Rangifer tarandus platyrhynchus TaxID=3082113 RepID=A0ABN8YBN4_RANTA|nr:unnamed protein product [Rangifer tarandus platyrhynchus]
MSKLSFRARALHDSKPLPVFRCEDLPDLHEYAWISRAAPDAHRNGDGGRSTYLRSGVFWHLSVEYHLILGNHFETADWVRRAVCDCGTEQVSLEQSDRGMETDPTQTLGFLYTMESNHPQVTISQKTAEMRSLSRRHLSHSHNHLLVHFGLLSLISL